MSNSKEIFLNKTICVQSDKEITLALAQFPSEQIEVDLRNYKINIKLFSTLNPAVLKKYQVLPLLTYQEYLLLAIDEKQIANSDLKTIIRLDSGYKPIFLKADASQIKRIINFYLGSKDNNDSFHSQNIKETQTLTKIKETAVAKADTLLNNAIELNASDIHIFPEYNHYKILFRIDGILHQMQSLNIAQAQNLIARIKILANLNLTEKQLPQDGSISVSVKKGKVDFRVSLIPTVDGDSLVLRVLDSIENIKALTELGFGDEAVNSIKDMIVDSGIILVTGQTGSGKSTTIYALINELKKKNLNIITIEDPVEYKLEGVRQIQIYESIGYDFPAALRSILRHDPDVIVIGEIRDSKTAQIAIQSALTGHLVISTLHTRSAIASITRLLEIGIADYLLTSVLKGVVAQKLVRKICNHCRGKSCQNCGYTGYLGRTPIYEILAITQNLASFINSRTDEDKILEKAKEQGFVSIAENANKLIKEHITDKKEINRKLYGFES